jgi:hypothetical protein
MEAKMGRFFESVGNFFTGGDNIPWCDRDLIAVRTPEIPFLAASIRILITVRCLVAESRGERGLVVGWG